MVMRKIIIALFSVLVLSSVANAQLIDFEDLGVAPGGQLDPPDNTVITSGGFDFINGPGSSFPDLHVPNGNARSVGGTSEMAAHNDLIMTKNGGGIFSVSSFQFGSTFGETPFDVVGSLSGGGTVSQSFIPDGNKTTLELFFLGSGFTNLTSINWLHPGVVAGSFNIDNINTTPVPLPAALILFGTGLAGLVGTRIRRKRE